jgi:hypothetical protein
MTTFSRSFPFVSSFANSCNWLNYPRRLLTSELTETTWGCHTKKETFTGSGAVMASQFPVRRRSCQKLCSYTKQRQRLLGGCPNIGCHSNFFDAVLQSWSDFTIIFIIGSTAQRGALAFHRSFCQMKYPAIASSDFVTRVFPRVGLSAPRRTPGYTGRPMFSVRVVSLSRLVPILKSQEVRFQSDIILNGLIRHGIKWHQHTREFMYIQGRWVACCKICMQCHCFPDNHWLHVMLVTGCLPHRRTDYSTAME